MLFQQICSASNMTYVLSRSIPGVVMLRRVLFIVFATALQALRFGITLDLTTQHFFGMLGLRIGLRKLFNFPFPISFLLGFVGCGVDETNMPLVTRFGHILESSMLLWTWCRTLLDGFFKKICASLLLTWMFGLLPQVVSL